MGFGDSLTLRQLGLADALAARGQVFDPAGARDDAAFYALAGQAMTAEVFLTSANALARLLHLDVSLLTGSREPLIFCPFVRGNCSTALLGSRKLIYTLLYVRGNCSTA